MGDGDEQVQGNHFYFLINRGGDCLGNYSNLLLMFLPLKQNVPLAPYTAFGVGGRARYFVSVSDPVELVKAVCLAKEKNWPYYLVAGGSNIVFGDKPLRGLVIRYFNSRGLIYCQGLTLTCETGVPLERLIKTAIGNGLAGLETLSGIPGTVGGAIVGNVGAYGQTISDCLTRVEVFDPETFRTCWFTRKQCRFAYRESIFKLKNCLILGAEFKLAKSDKKTLIKKSREIIKIRSGKYDPSLRCPGSFFKNVLVEDISRRAKKLIDQTKIRDGKIPAGYLLEAAGAKGMRRGGIYVADFHGNLLINDGRGTYRDVVALVAELKKLVKEKFGIILEEEIKYML